MEEILSLGLWVKQRRRAFDITQDGLAMLVDCSVETIRKIEGDARRPSRQIAQLLAQHLNLPPQEQQRFVRVARGLLSPAHLPPPREYAAGAPPLASARPIHDSRGPGSEATAEARGGYSCAVSMPAHPWPDSCSPLQQLLHITPGGAR